MKIGIIGGSGLEKLNVFHSKEELTLETPFGDPSSTVYSGRIADREIFILSRHDRDHHIHPTVVNNQANIYAFKMLGCDYILATTACGSLCEEIRPGDLVIPGQAVSREVIVRVFKNNAENIRGLLLAAVERLPG